MRSTQAGVSGLVRVTVASSRRRVDLVLPAAVPVAELVPELARSVGILDAATAYGGYRVVTADGRTLAPDAGLALQGVEDGGVLSVSAAADEPPARRYDDVVEAMADLVEADLPGWDAAASRRTALAGAAALLGVGAYAFVVQPSQAFGALGAGVMALILVAASIVLGRVRREPQVALVLAWVAIAYGGVAGAVLARGEPMLGAVGIGLGVLAVAVPALVGLDGGRALLLPGVFVGVVLAGAGWLVHLVDLDPAKLLAVVLVISVIAGSVFPWLALSATATRAPMVGDDPDAVGGEVEAARVLGDARAAHEILLGLSCAVVGLLVLLTPAMVALGGFGALLAALCAVIVMLRTRQYRTRSEVLVGLLGGVVALVVGAMTAVLTEPDWRPAGAVVCAVAGALVLLVALVPVISPVRRSRLGDLAEGTALAALLPVLVLALGLAESLGLVGG